MKKSIGLIVLAACMFVAAPAYAISITVHLADDSGKALSNANCIATDENHKKSQLFNTSDEGKATIEKFDGKTHVLCSQGKEQQMATTLSNPTEGSKHQLAKKGLFGVTIHF